MTILEQVYASAGPDVIIITLELSCAAWAAPIRICSGFEDQTLGGELFSAAGIDVALPRKTNTGGQSLTFAIDNVLGTAQQLIDQALEAGADVTLTYRTFLASDKTAPAEAPYVFSVKGGRMRGSTLQVSAAFFDAINTRFPRDLYTTEFAPGIKYL